MNIDEFAELYGIHPEEVNHIPCSVPIYMDKDFEALRDQIYSEARAFVNRQKIQDLPLFVYYDIDEDALDRYIEARKEDYREDCINGITFYWY